MWVRQTAEVGVRPSAPESKGVAALREEFPAVHEYLTLESFPGGGERQRSTLIIFIEDGRWKICLSDRETASSLWSSGDTLDDCLMALDASIQGGSPTWRTQSTPRKGKAGK